MKNPPAMRGTWVQSLGWKDPLAGSMATHSSILAGESSLTEEPGRLHTVHGVAKRAGHDWVTKHSTRHAPLVWNFASKCPYKLQL